MEDLRERIFSRVADRIVGAAILAEDGGIIAGTRAVMEEALKLKLSLEEIISEGGQVEKGDVIVRFSGSPKQIAMAEEILMGVMAKASGIATAAHRATRMAGGRPKIVCGAWKKMPPVLKEVLRQAVTLGGAACSLSPDPFVYLDKNHIEMLGGIRESLTAVRDLEGHRKVVQLKGKRKEIVSEAEEAVVAGADIVFIDTGRAKDVETVMDRLVKLGVRERIEVAFAGGVKIEDILKLKALDVDYLCIGREILDAPLLDMKMEVMDTDEAGGGRS